MRVTQSMLSSNMLRNLSKSYSRLGKMQNQLTTGKKVNRPSDNPVVAMKGIAYRHQVEKVNQFKTNIGHVHNWLDSTDAALDNAGQALHRARELMVNAPTDSMTPSDRHKILEELKQLRDGVRDIANSKVGDKYIFAGTKTGRPVSKDGKTMVSNEYQNQLTTRQTELQAKEAAGQISDAEKMELEVVNYQIDNFNKLYEPVEGAGREVKIEVFDGVELQVNTIGGDLFGEIDARFELMIQQIESPDHTDLDKHITSMDDALNRVLEDRAVVGSRQNRAELMDHRLDFQEMAARKQMSQNEDVEYEKVITELITQESIHRAALSVGARVIQPSLVDFLR